MSRRGLVARRTFRGQSELVGLILVFGMVIAGATTVVVFGASAISDSQETLSVQRAEKSLTQLDSKAALVALGSPRTGVMVAMDEAGVPLDLPLLLASVLIAASISVTLVVVLGDRYLTVVGRFDPTRLAIVILGALVALAFLFAGFVGVGVFGIATIVGLVPPRFRARRVSLMGVLLVPLIL